MGKTVERLTVGIFGPSDCSDEKNRLRRLIAEDPSLRVIANRFDLILQACSGDDVTSGPGRPQERINRYIAEMDPDLSIFVFKDSFGSDAGLGWTGTEEEWRNAIDTLSTHPEFDIGLYFRAGTPTDPRVSDFRTAVEKAYVAYYTVFEDLADFESKLRHKLTVLLTDHASKKNLKPEVVSADAVGSFAASPFSVATYPRSLPGGEELPRPELQTLLERIQNSESSATVVLGERGSGKSALFAALEAELRAKDIAVLSIKADMLGTDVRDEVALDRALHLPLGFAASVQLVATQRPVAVLVDQLDALADVLDRRTERLNILLNVIRSVSNVRNVHLVVSSRPFEYHHDVRLRSMDAERLDLELPPWTAVAPVLAKNGYAAESIAEAVRELLRNPWTLNEFLRLRPKELSFDSLFALLEQVWAVTVDASYAPAGTRELVTAMVTMMSKEEVLWVPRAVASAHEAARQYLLDRDIIQLDESQIRLAFRHQSFFEFALVRRFAAGGESFAGYVLERSQGLFIRPVALAGLAYIRGTVPSRYEAELRTLWDARPRAHLRALILDFIAGQNSPLPTEVAIVTQMLGDDRAGQRALGAIAPYGAWFPILRPTAAFVAWLRRPPTEAIHVTGLLARHASRSPEDVLDVLEREWLGRPEYDRLSFSVLYNLTPWSERAMEVLLHVVRRSTHAGVYDLALQMIESNPHLAARLLRAELDRRLDEIIGSGNSGYELERAVERLLEEDEHTGVFADLSENCPEALIAWLLPWIVRVVEVTAGESERFQQYRHTPINVTAVGMKPVASLLDATICALEQIAADPDAALEAITPHLESESMGVHALASLVLRGIAGVRPDAVADYLLGDSRRLAIGDWARAHRFSKLLIEAVLPHGTQEHVRSLESAVLAYDYYIAPDEDLSEEQRMRKAPWNREHRLFLLQSFPDRYLSEEGLQTKRQLEAEFPGLDESMFGEMKGGWVEARYNRAELEKQSDDEIVAVFDELTDDTGWDHPRRWSDGDRLIGGAVQQSRVVAELAEADPDRVFRLTQRFRPHDQELPTAEAITGLAKTDYDPQQQVGLILDLAAKGFRSEDFITSAARALQKLSGKLFGLSDPVLDLLLRWLRELDAPSLADAREANDTPSDHPVVFGPGGFFVQPHGRGPVIEAIASGYLDRNPPDVAKWVEVVRAQLDVEQHPGVWVMTLRHLQDVMKHDPALGTELFTGIFERHREVLREPVTWLLVAHWMRGFTPNDAVLRWLDLLAGFEDPRSQQAFGELLYLYVMRHPESRERVQAYLPDAYSRYVVRGFAYAAAYLWANVSTRTLGVDVFAAEIERWPEDAAKTLSSLIFVNRDEFELDEPTQKVFRTAATNQAVLLDIFPELGEEIEPRTVQEPAFVADIARAFVAAPIEQVEGSLGPIHRGNVPEVITSIALTLHRMPAFAEVGLELFEKLLDANLREAKAATELLDRKPSRLLTPHARRPRRPRRRRSRPIEQAK
jgi:hypothetical protein